MFVLAALAGRTGAQEAARASRPEAADDKRWQTVAPGRVEPSSGEIRIAAPVMGVIAQVLVKVNDKVTAGEPLIRLVDDEAQARLAAAEAQVAFRLRARNEEAAPVRPTARRTAEAAIADTDKAAARRRAEDAVADADKAVAYIETQGAPIVANGAVCGLLPSPLPLSGTGVAGGPTLAPSLLTFAAPCGGALKLPRTATSRSLPL